MEANNNKYLFMGDAENDVETNSNTNSYGYPSETVIKRLQDKECEIYRTA